MKLHKDELVCGQPARVVRDVIDQISQCGFQLNQTFDFYHRAGLSIVDMHQLIRALYEQGYLESMDFEGEDHVVVSELGQRVLNTSFIPRMKRATVERLVQLLIERAAETELYTCFYFRVNKLWLFGSYLDETADDFGDLDVVFHLSESTELTADNKAVGKTLYDIAMLLHHRGVLPYPLPVYRGKYSWSRSLTLKQLKQSNNAISLHGLDDFVRLKTEHALLIYDADQGGAIKPKKVTRSSITKWFEALFSNESEENTSQSISTGIKDG